MKVGVPKELKNHEYRVAITPAGVHELSRAGHQVFLEEDAGTGSAIPDADFVAAGATIPGAAAGPAVPGAAVAGTSVLRAGGPAARPPAAANRHTAAATVAKRTGHLLQDSKPPAGAHGYSG